MLEAVKFPAGIADLNTSLTNVDWDALPHFRRKVTENLKGMCRNKERNHRLSLLNEGVYQDALFWKPSVMDLREPHGWYIYSRQEKARDIEVGCWLGQSEWVGSLWLAVGVTNLLTMVCHFFFWIFELFLYCRPTVPEVIPFCLATSLGFFLNPA